MKLRRQKPVEDVLLPHRAQRRADDLRRRRTRRRQWRQAERKALRRRRQCDHPDRWDRLQLRRTGKRLPAVRLTCQKCGFRTETFGTIGVSPHLR